MMIMLWHLSIVRIEREIEARTSDSEDDGLGI